MWQMLTFVEGIRPDEFAAVDVGAVVADPAYPLPGQIVTIRVPLRNSGLRRLEGVTIGVLVAGRMVARRSLDLDVDVTEEAVLEWGPVPAGSLRITVVVDPDRRLPLDPQDRPSVMFSLLVSDRPSDVVLRDLRWRAATRSIEVELHNGSGAPAYAPVMIAVDGETVRRTVVGPIPPQGSSVLATSWFRSMRPGALTASVDLPEADHPSAAGDVRAATVLTRDLRPEAELEVEGLSVAAVKSLPDQPRRLTVSAQVVNTGRSPTRGRCPVDLAIWPAGSSEPTRHSLLVAPLVPGSAVAVSHSFDLPAGVNTATVDVVADPDDRIAPPTPGKRAQLEFRNPVANVGRWVSIGPTLIPLGLGAVGRLHQILLDPTRPGTMFVASGGASGSGVWRTRDGGANWDPVTDGFGTPNVKAMAMDPSDSRRLWAATPRGLLHTDDGGDSWQFITSATALPVDSRAGADSALRVDPNHAATLHLTGSAGVQRSVDGGATWSVVLDSGHATDLVVDSSSSGRLYAAIRNDLVPAQTGVYQSDDHGGSWRQLTGCPGGRLPVMTGPTVIRLAISGSTLYASFMEIGVGWTLYRTTSVGCLIGGRQESVWEAGWSPGPNIVVDGEPIFRRLWKGIYANPVQPEDRLCSGNRPVGVEERWHHVRAPHGTARRPPGVRV